MKLEGVHRRSIEPTGDGRGVRILDQRRLPWEVTLGRAYDVIAEEAARAITRDVDARRAAARR